MATRRRSWLKRKERYGGRLNAKKRAQFMILSRTMALHKIEKGCADCGYRKHHAALEFDHVRGVKRRCVSAAATMIAFLSEAQKCDVVCANCHRVRTYTRMGVNIRDGIG